MSIVAVVHADHMKAVNAALAEDGFGPSNFSVACYGTTGVTHAALHAWEDAAFRAALALVPGVVVGDPEDEGDPVTLTAALIAAQGAKWGVQAPELPTTGNVTAGSLYRFEDALWSVIQTFNRSTYGAHPNTYPALIRRIRDPYKAESWRQPIDQYDSYKLINPFTGKADETEHGGKLWRTKVDNNVWEPAVGALWDEIDADGNVVTPPEPPAEEYPQWVQPTGAHDAYKIGDKVTFNGQRYTSKINGNVWSPTGYPAGWQAQP